MHKYFVLDLTKMTISRATRTHLVYQFIILTLLFMGIGYNELLPDRKFVLFLAFMPIFCYQLIILSCCLELVALPQWLNFSEPKTQKITKVEIDVGTQSSPVVSSRVSSSETVSENTDFLDASEKLYASRRWEKSTVCLQNSPKDRDRPQKSKSWVNLSDSRRILDESLSREGSLEVIAPLVESRLRYPVKLSKADRISYRDKRANKAKSWKPGSEQDFEARYKLDFPTSKQSIQDIESSQQKSDFTQQTKTESSKKTQNEQPRKPVLGSCVPVQQEESELNKSYSFPFRQKRLETWLEMKETETRDSNQSLNMPYWQTVGYNLAVKYEARRRRRAVSTPNACNNPTETQGAFQNSVEIPADSTSSTKLVQKKPKSASACINKIKTGFSNLISKVKEEISESTNSKTSKPAFKDLCPKIKAKVPNAKVKENELTMPEFPQFLSNERPLIFYPKYIPFEKERFEGDVKKKMVELANEKDQNFKL